MVRRSPRRAGRVGDLLLVFLGLAVVAGVACLDYAAGAKLLLSIFYLLPVMMVAWWTRSTLYGLLVALASAVAGPVVAYLLDFGTVSLPVSLWNNGVRLTVFCVVLYLLHRMRVLNEGFEEMALSDELTGLVNLRGFRQVAALEIERSVRYEHEFSLAYIDIDDFKNVNDQRGHGEGDRVLQALAGIAKATARTSDTVARIGGDEFVILMPETGPEVAVVVVTRLLEMVRRGASRDRVTVTCSIGLASFREAPDSVALMLAAADQLLYSAKAAGRDAMRQGVFDAQTRLPAQGRVLPFAAQPKG
jgi:diguanylate cyclase (GGDEF)-like protein